MLIHGMQQQTPNTNAYTEASGTFKLRVFNTCVSFGLLRSITTLSL